MPKAVTLDLALPRIAISKKRKETCPPFWAGFLYFTHGMALHPVASGPGELFEQSWIHQEASDIRK